MAQSETDMIIIIILVPVPYLIHFSRRRSKLLVLTIADIDQILLDIFLESHFLLSSLSSNKLIECQFIYLDTVNVKKAFVIFVRHFSSTIFSCLESGIYYI